MRLTTRLHDRDVAGLTYVYPVVSRRAEGVSVGVNLNPNNLCNWRCVYCQVPGLGYGKGPAIDLALLREELDGMLAALVRGDYMERHVPEGARRLNDVAFSGNGEPTSSPSFAASVDIVAASLEAVGLLGELPIVLITNGSLLHQTPVKDGLDRLARSNGVVWFKLDSATDAGAARLNGNRAGIARTRTNLALACERLPTWIQTMALAWNGEGPSEEEQEAYLAFLADHLREAPPPRGVLLYGLARPSHQPEAEELSALPESWLATFADRIRGLGLEVRVSP